MNIVALLEKIRAVSGLKSNRQIALRIGTDPKQFTMWEHGRGIPGDKNLIKLCDLAGEDRFEWLLWAHAERGDIETGGTWNALLSQYRSQRDILASTGENIFRTNNG